MNRTGSSNTFTKPCLEETLSRGNSRGLLVELETLIKSLTQVYRVIDITARVRSRFCCGQCLVGPIDIGEVLITLAGFLTNVTEAWKTAAHDQLHAKHERHRLKMKLTASTPSCFLPVASTAPVAVPSFASRSNTHFLEYPLHRRVSCNGRALTEV